MPQGPPTGQEDSGKAGPSGLIGREEPPDASLCLGAAPPHGRVQTHQRAPQERNLDVSPPAPGNSPANQSVRDREFTPSYDQLTCAGTLGNTSVKEFPW